MSEKEKKQAIPVEGEVNVETEEEKEEEPKKVAKKAPAIDIVGGLKAIVGGIATLGGIGFIVEKAIDIVSGFKKD